MTVSLTRRAFVGLAALFAGGGSSDEQARPAARERSTRTASSTSASSPPDARVQAVYQANQIRANAGIPSTETVGPRGSPGLADEAAVSASSEVHIRSDSDASEAAVSGSGTT